MDIVYLNTKTENNCKELLFSLRSIEKYLSFDSVVVIGYLPPFLNLKRIRFIEYPENLAHKWNNVLCKLKKIIEMPDITDDFILMNDDFWLMKEYKEIPYYYDGFLKDKYKQYPYNEYRTRLYSTYLLFPEGKNYEVHFPIVYNKDRLREIFEKYDNIIERRSAYCNHFHIEGAPTKDYIVRDIKELDKMKDAPFLSATDEVFADERFQNFLLDKFPEPSIFEVDRGSEVYQEIQKFQRLIEQYKRENPTKYEQKKDEFENKIKHILLKYACLSPKIY